MKEATTNIRRVLDDIMDHPMLRDVTLDQAVRYTVRFMQKVGCPFIFTEKCEVLEIHHYKAKLPCDFYKIIQVKDCHTGLCYRSATDSFHMGHFKTSRDFTYKIQSNVLVSSVEEGFCEIAYLAMETDEDGFPVIPDDEVFLNALELYIKKERFQIIYDQGKLQLNQIEMVKQDYGFAVGQLMGRYNDLSTDEWESITNMMTQLIPNKWEHQEGYSRLGEKEIMRTH